MIETVIAAFAVLLAWRLLAATWRFAVRLFGRKTFSGAAYVIDGDTLSVAGYRVRLLDIDAPELGQRARGRQAIDLGAMAKQELINLLARRPVDVHARGLDCYGRLLADVYVDGTNVAGALVRAGLALPDQRSRRYSAEGDAARLGRLGIWRYRFDDPAEYRRRGGHEGGGVLQRF